MIIKSCFGVQHNIFIFHNMFNEFSVDLRQTLVTVSNTIYIYIYIRVKSNNKTQRLG